MNAAHRPGRRAPRGLSILEWDNPKSNALGVDGRCRRCARFSWRGLPRSAIPSGSACGRSRCLYQLRGHAHRRVVRTCFLAAPEDGRPMRWCTACPVSSRALGIFFDTLLIHAAELSPEWLDRLSGAPAGPPARYPDGVISTGLRGAIRSPRCSASRCRGVRRSSRRPKSASSGRWAPADLPREAGGDRSERFGF